jgi:hypothetical protein
MLHHNFLLSVLLPTYNYSFGVNRILEPFSKVDPSLIGKIEFIISDDSDLILANKEIQKITNFYKHRYSFNLRYITGTKTKNPVDNWNNLLEKSSGKFKQIIHHDEFFMSHLDIEDLLLILNSSKHEIYILKLYTTDKFFYYDHIPNLVTRFLLRFFLNSLLLINYIGPSACIVFKSFTAKKFNRRLMWIVDSDWFYRGFLGNNKIFFCDSIAIVSESNYENSITKKIVGSKIYLKYKELVKINFKFNLLHVIFLILWPIVKIYGFLSNLFRKILVNDRR